MITYSVACGIPHLHGEWLVLMCCDAIDVCPERMLAKSSVYTKNTCFVLCCRGCVFGAGLAKSSVYMGNGSFFFCFVDGEIEATTW